MVHSVRRDLPCDGDTKLSSISMTVPAGPTKTTTSGRDHVHGAAWLRLRIEGKRRVKLWVAGEVTTQPKSLSGLGQDAMLELPTLNPFAKANVSVFQRSISSEGCHGECCSPGKREPMATGSLNNDCGAPCRSRPTPSAAKFCWDQVCPFDRARKRRVP